MMKEIRTWKKWQKVKLTHELLALVVLVLGVILSVKYMFDMCPWISWGGFVLALIGLGYFVEIRNENYKVKYPEETR